MFSSFIGKNKITIFTRCSYKDRIVISNPDGSPMDLTGCEVKSELRTEDNALAATFTCTMNDPTTGEIDRKLTKEDTANLIPCDMPNHVWGVRITMPDGLTLPEIQGGAIINESVVG